MDLRHIAKATAQTLISYLTYQAVRTVLEQLHETDPPQALWLNQFSSQTNIQDGEVYLQALLQERQELAFRIMTVRAHLADQVVEFLPEMVTTGIHQANMAHRRQFLERMTQIPLSSPSGSLPEGSVMEDQDDHDRPERDSA